MPMNSGSNFVKSFMLTRKLSQQSGGKAFGTKPAPAASWQCESCKAENPTRKDKCRCGADRPKGA